MNARTALLLALLVAPGVLAATGPQDVVLLAKDLSGNGNHLVPNNTTRVQGIDNLSLQFNGHDSTARVNATPNTDDELTAATLTFRIRLDQAPTANVRVIARQFQASTSLHTSVFINNARLVCGYFGRQVLGVDTIQSVCSSSTNSSLAVGAWADAAITYDGARATVWYAGAPVASAAMTGNVVATTKPFNLGSNGGSSEYCACTVDDVRYYNYALTDGELDLVANATPTGGDPRIGLLFQWRFDEIWTDPEHDTIIAQTSFDPYVDFFTLIVIAVMAVVLILIGIAAQGLGPRVLILVLLVAIGYVLMQTTYNPQYAMLQKIVITVNIGGALLVGVAAFRRK